MKRLRARDWAFISLILIVAVVCIRLAFWQISRLNERRSQNAYILSQLEHPALDLPSPGLTPEEIAFRHVTVRGTFDAQHEIMLKNRSHNGQSGYHLVTPLRIEGSEESVLVDRGWISIEAAGDDQRQRFILHGIQDLTGIARLSQPEPGSFLADPIPAPNEPPLKAWRVLNIEGIQNQIPYPLLSIYIEQTEPPMVTATMPIPDSEIDLSEGPHLAYTIQWFSFAAIAILGGIFWFTRTLKPTLTDV